jgi:hypothetical protein
MNKRTSVVGLIAAALLGGLLPAAPAQAAVAVCGGGRSAGALATTFYTFTVDAKPMKKSYAIGEKMKVAMKVQRPGREDPVGEGLPIESPQYMAAADVEVSVSLYAGDYFYRYGLGKTDENGEAIITVPAFPKAAPAGPIRAAVAARAYYNRGGCPDIEEAGYNQYEPFFVATK